MPKEPQPLLRRRRQLVDSRIQERNRLDKGISTAGSRSIQNPARFDQEIAQVDMACQSRLQRRAVHRQQATVYRSVPGACSTTAALQVAFLIA